MKKSKIIILILVLTAISSGFYFRNNIMSFGWKVYNNFGENLQKFQRINLENIVNEVKKEIFTPAPLNVGGEENEAVLTKAKIIAQTNIQRYNNETLPPLIENTKLDLAARAKAQDMFKNQYFDHVSPSGVDPGELVKNYGYDYIVAGENLILGNFKSEAELVQAWMDSPGHRANILNDRFADIGVAIVKGTYNGQTVWIGVQEFSLPISACAQPKIPLKNQIDSNKTRLDQMSLQIDAKKEEISNTNQKSSKYNVLVDEHNQLVAEYNSLTQETKNLIERYNNEVNNFNQCVVGK